MMFRLCFFVAASVAAVAVSRINTDSSRKRNCSNIEHSDGSGFQQTETEVEEKFTDGLSDEKVQQEEDFKRVTRKIMKQSFEMDIPEELLRNLEEELGERKLILERKSLELYGLKEQQSYVGQLRRNLEDKMTAIGMLNGAIDSLQDEVKNLQKEMRHAVLANEQLEVAEKMVEKLQKKMDFDASNMNGQLVLLEQNVSRFLWNKKTSFINNDVIEKNPKAARQVELEFVKVRRINKEVELEKRKLAVKLVDAQARIKALFNKSEDKIIIKIEKKMSFLRCNNEGLSEEVERLQRNRFNMVEELVYQRWLNACLRFETQNYKKPSRKASNYDEKAKQVVLNRCFDSISSFTSSTESNEIDSSTSISSSHSWRSGTKKSSIMPSIKQWGEARMSQVLLHHQISFVEEAF